VPEVESELKWLKLRIGKSVAGNSNKDEKGFYVN